MQGLHKMLAAYESQAGLCSQVNRGLKCSGGSSDGAKGKAVFWVCELMKT